TKVNVPLPPFTGDDLWMRAFSEVVPPLVEAWAPDVLVTQLGCDTHHHDPLAELHLTTGAYRRTAGVLHELAHRAAGGRWVATGGGGYQWARVVPRAWTLYFAEMAGVAVPDEIPGPWREEAAAPALTGRAARDHPDHRPGEGRGLPVPRLTASVASRPCTTAGARAAVQGPGHAAA